MKTTYLSMDEKINIANRLRILREDMGYTQEAFATYIGVSLSSYKKIEECQNNVSIKNLFRLHEKGLSADYILFGEGPDKDEIWKNIDSCNHDDKFSLFIRLLLYIKGVNIKEQLDLLTAEKVLEYLNDLLQEKN